MLGFSSIWSFAIAHHTLHQSNVIELVTRMMKLLHWTLNWVLCFPFFSIVMNQYCSIAQLKCIEENQIHILADKHQERIKSCLSTCTEMHVDLVGYVVIHWCNKNCIRTYLRINFDLLSISSICEWRWKHVFELLKISKMFYSLPSLAKCAHLNYSNCIILDALSMSFAPIAMNLFEKPSSPTGE